MRDDCERSPCLGDRPATPGWAYALSIALILAVHTMGRLGSYCTDVRSDSYTYAAFAYRMVCGDVLYEDMSLDKPPGLMVLNMLPYLVMPASRTSLIPLETIGLLLGYWAFYLLGRSLYDKTTGLILAVAACIGANYFAVLDFTGEGFGLAETYMFALHAGAALLYVRAWRADRWWVLSTCGALIGLSAAIKQTAAPVGAAMGLHWIAACVIRDRDHRRALGGAFRLLAGFAAGVAPFVVMVVAQETWWRASREVFYSSARWLRRDTGWPTAWAHVTPLWAPMVWIVLAAYVHARRVVHRMSPVEDRREDAAALTAESDRAGDSPALTGRGEDRRGDAAALTSGTDDRRGDAAALTAEADRAGDSPALTGRAGVADRVLVASFLVVWLVLECVMLVYLPRRSFHYYILSMMPLLLLSGAMWRAVLEEPAGTARQVVVAGLLLWSAAVIRPALAELVPVSLIRYRAFDAAEDQDHFEHVVRWENGTRGINDGRWPGASE